MCVRVIRQGEQVCAAVRVFVIRVLEFILRWVRGGYLCVPTEGLHSCVRFPPGHGLHGGMVVLSTCSLVPVAPQEGCPTGGSLNLHHHILVLRCVWEGEEEGREQMKDQKKTGCLARREGQREADHRIQLDMDL